MRFGGAPNRPIPAMATNQYKTYSLQAPIKTHYRKATCAEVNCEHYLKGWNIPLQYCDEQMLWIIKNSGRRYTVQRLDDSGAQYAVFAPGQECFKSGQHLKALEREPLYLVGRGDWRSFIPRKAKQHANGDEWVDDFSTHQDLIKRILDRA